GNPFRGARVGQAPGLGGSLVVSFTATQNDCTVAQVLEPRSLRSHEARECRERGAVLTTALVGQVVYTAQPDRSAEGIRMPADTADCRECSERCSGQNGFDAIVVTVLADTLQDLLIYKGVVAILQTRAVLPR